MSGIASLVSSEYTGSANFFADDGGTGVLTTAKLVGDEYVLSGEKAWATNCGGWDYKGAGLLCVVCWMEETGSASASGAIILMSREDIDKNQPNAFEVIGDIDNNTVLTDNFPPPQWHRE